MGNWYRTSRLPMQILTKFFDLLVSSKFVFSSASKEELEEQQDIENIDPLTCTRSCW